MIGRTEKQLKHDLHMLREMCEYNQDSFETLKDAYDRFSDPTVLAKLSPEEQIRFIAYMEPYKQLGAFSQKNPFPHFVKDPDPNEHGFKFEEGKLTIIDSAKAESYLNQTILDATSVLNFPDKSTDLLELLNVCSTNLPLFTVFLSSIASKIDPAFHKTLSNVILILPTQIYPKWETFKELKDFAAAGKEVSSNINENPIYFSDFIAKAPYIPFNNELRKKYGKEPVLAFLTYEHDMGMKIRELNREIKALEQLWPKPMIDSSQPYTKEYLEWKPFHDLLGRMKEYLQTKMMSESSVSAITQNKFLRGATQSTVVKLYEDLKEIQVSNQEEYRARLKIIKLLIVDFIKYKSEDKKEYDKSKMKTKEKLAELRDKIAPQDTAAAQQTTRAAKPVTTSPATSSEPIIEPIINDAPELPADITTSVIKKSVAIISEKVNILPDASARKELAAMITALKQQALSTEADILDAKLIEKFTTFLNLADAIKIPEALADKAVLAQKKKDFAEIKVELDVLLNPSHDAIPSLEDMEMPEEEPSAAPSSAMPDNNTDDLEIEIDMIEDIQQFVEELKKEFPPEKPAEAESDFGSSDFGPTEFEELANKDTPSPAELRSVGKVATEAPKALIPEEVATIPIVNHDEILDKISQKLTEASEIVKKIDESLKSIALSLNIKLPASITDFSMFKKPVDSTQPREIEDSTAENKYEGPD